MGWLIVTTIQLVHVSILSPELSSFPSFRFNALLRWKPILNLLPTPNQAGSNPNKSIFVLHLSSLRWSADVHLFSLGVKCRWKWVLGWLIGFQHPVAIMMGRWLRTNHLKEGQGYNSIKLPGCKGQLAALKQLTSLGLHNIYGIDAELKSCPWNQVKSRMF